MKDGSAGCDRAGQVRQWYTERAREFLAQHDLERVHGFDRDLSRIDALEQQLAEERAVCFLGHSGVGKSTLINALVTGTRTILPQGGIGPLTAQATSVRWAPKPYFQATYLSPAKLNRLIFALDRHHDRRRGTGVGASEPVSAQASGEQLALDPEDRAEVQADVADAGSGGEGSDRIVALLRQARLLVCGSPAAQAEVAYLADCLRAALRRSPRYCHEPTGQDARRVLSLQQALILGQMGKSRCEEGEITDKTFRGALREHASGHLAPLIEKLEVGWDSAVLSSGLRLVDLPGLGVANDEYRNVTQEWVRHRAKAIALVVDRSGITQESADLLRSSGFFGRLLHAADDPFADPVQLIVVAVKLDLTADDEWRDERSLDREKARPWTEHFESVRAKMCQTLRAQFRDQIVSALRQSSSDQVKDDVERVLKRLIDDLRIYTVSATEFRKLALGDEEDPPHIDETTQSGIPQLQEALGELAGQHRKAIDDRLAASSDHLVERVRDTLEVMRTQWEEGERPLEEIEHLRSEIDSFLFGSSGLRRELHSRQGAFREFLTASVPERIRDLVEEAGQTAESEIREYLADLKSAHWATLRAAVRRGGTFLHGIARHVDIPNDFAVRIDEPVGLIWSKRILGTVRKRTSDLAADYIGFVEYVTTWAFEQGITAGPRKLEALQREMRADARALNAVGKEKVEDLRQAVRQQLLQRIKEPIRKRCKEFVETGQDQGTGTKRRILELFSELVPQVVQSAKPTANRVLLSNFRKVELEIREVFDKYPDPLVRAAETLVASEETRLRRQDSDRRENALSRIDSILSTAPRAAREGEA